MEESLRLLAAAVMQRERKDMIYDLCAAWIQIGFLKIMILSLRASRERGREQEQPQGYRRRRRWWEIGSSERDERCDDAMFDVDVLGNCEAQKDLIRVVIRKICFVSDFDDVEASVEAREKVDNGRWPMRHETVILILSLTNTNSVPIKQHIDATHNFTEALKHWSTEALKHWSTEA
jgi:hypothetical protein